MNRGRIHTNHPCGGTPESYANDRWWAAHEFNVILNVQHDVLSQLYSRVRKCWNTRSTLRKRLDHVWKVRRLSDRARIYVQSERYHLEDEITKLNFELAICADSFISTLARDLDELRVGSGLDVRDCGMDVFRGLTIGTALWALGNRVRHAHEWGPSVSKRDKATRTILARLPAGEDDDASAQFLMVLPLHSYSQWDQLLRTIGYSAMEKLDAGTANGYVPPICFHDLPNPGGNVLYDYRECRNTNSRGIVIPYG
jgi:hypothetical protein